MRKNNRILNIFKKLKAVQNGHFVLTSGNHSDTYVQCSRIMENPSVTTKLCKILAKPWQKTKVDLVAGPAVGGIIITYELARILKARAIFAERVNNKLTLRRGFAINPKEKVLVVEDVITTGGSAKEVINIVKKHNAKVAGVVSLVNRSGKPKAPFSVKFNALLKITPPLYKPKQCPLCKAGIAISKPGSRKL